MADEAAPKNNYQAGAPDETPKNPDKKIRKVITGEVTVRKTPFYVKVRDYFAGEDTKSVATYVLFEVVLPEVKSLLFNAFNQGLERKLFGGQGGPRTPTQARGYVAYNRVGAVVNAAIANRPAAGQPIARPENQFENIVVASRAEAQEVLDQLNELVENYTCALVADLYETVNLPSQHTDQKWGWTDLRSASIRPVGNGYLLVLPRPIAID